MNDNAIFHELIILLATVAFVTAAFRKLKLNPILGLLAAGIVLGPRGFSMLPTKSSLSFLSEMGIMFLLFIVGLELSVERIRATAKTIFGLGTAHFILSAACITLAMKAWTGQWPVSIALGTALSMSSTAFVLQLLAEREETEKDHGRQTFAVLLFQDLMVPPMLAILPMFALMVLGGKATDLAPEDIGHPTIGLGVAALAMILVFVVAKLLLEETLSAVRDPGKHDAFPAAILLVAIVMGWIAHALGLSSSFGAFLAGLALAGAEWRQEIKNVIKPFEATLLAFFFIGVGTIVPLDGDPAQLLRLLVATAALMSVKTLAGIAACKINGLSWGSSLRTSTLLAQSGEFSFLLVSALAVYKFIRQEDAELWIGAAVISMAATPFLSAAAAAFVESDLAETVRAKFKNKSAREPTQNEPEENKPENDPNA